MKKLRALGIGLAVAAVSVTPFILPKEVDAKDSSYYNWSQLRDLDEQYAYAKIYRTPTTRITAKKYDATRPSDDEDETSETAYVVNTTNGQVVILLEDTTAVDKNGNKVDVIFRLSNFRKWDYGSEEPPATQDAYFFFRNTICGTDQELTTREQAESACSGSRKRLGNGDPIMFWLQVNYSDIDFSVEYIKKGSYNDSTTKGTPVSSIDRLAFAAFDFDVKYNKSDELFDGSEGISLNSSIVPQSSKTTFYYQKDDKSSYMSLQEGNNGIAIDVNGIGNKYNGIYYANSTLGVVTGMKNSTYTFRYSAGNAGISLFFGSAVTYDTPAPKKFIVETGKTACDEDDCSSNVVTTGDKFNYVISQDVPDQYSSSNDMLTFMSLWSRYPNIAQNHLYTSFAISDTVDENLTLSKVSDIKIYDKTNADVTNKFTLSYTNGNITAVAKSDTLSSESFYANTYRIVAPVTVKDTVNKGLLKNTATTTFTNTGTSDESKDSNEVETRINHKVIVKHISNATGEELAEPTTTIYNHGDAYETTALTAEELPKNYKISQTLPENASGTVTKDIVVIYYYDLYHTVTTKHIAKQTGAEIADTVFEEYIHGANYETVIAKKLPEGYQLTKVPINATGVVDDDIEVIYVYDIPPAPKTLDSDPAPFAFIFAGVGAFTAGFAYILTRRR